MAEGKCQMLQQENACNGRGREGRIAKDVEAKGGL